MEKEEAWKNHKEDCSGKMKLCERVDEHSFDAGWVAAMKEVDNVFEEEVNREDSSTPLELTYKIKAIRRMMKRLGDDEK